MTTFDRHDSDAEGLLSYEVTGQGDGTVIHLRGELDLASAATLAASLRPFERGHRAVVVDLSGLLFCDSSGLTALIRFRNEAAEYGTHVSLRHPTPAVRRLFELTSTDRLLSVDEDTAPGTLASGGGARG
jgi:anti-sigma B factor antagonist